MKFTKEFASHFSLDEYVHYLQCDCVEDAERLPLRVMVRHAETFGEVSHQRDYYEAQALDLDKVNQDLKEETENLKDTMLVLKKKYEEVDRLLDDVQTTINAAKVIMQHALL